VNKEFRVSQNKEGDFAEKLARSYQKFYYIPGNSVLSFKFARSF
jgi:hypothetical protein